MMLNEKGVAGEWWFVSAEAGVMHTKTRKEEEGAAVGTLHFLYIKGDDT
jgi:hypothetical protein